MIQSSASISCALLRLSIFCKRRSCRGEDLARLLVVEGAEEKGTAKDAFADAFGVWVLGLLVQLLTQTLSLVNTACVLLLTGFQQFLFFFFFNIPVCILLLLGHFSGVAVGYVQAHSHQKHASSPTCTTFPLSSD